MEKINHLGNIDPNKEFYFVFHDNGNCNLITAISKQGGYIYFLINQETSKQGSVKIAVTPITNILDYCGSPDAHVIEINPTDSQNREMCQIISDSIDKFSMQESKQKMQEPQYH